MIELYDNPVSTSAQKVRLVLAEKGLDYKAHVLNLQAGEQFAPEFLKINPSAQVPALVHGGNTYVESTVICEYLDDAFPEPPLRPASAHDRARMRAWTEQTVSWCITMINNINVGIVFAPMIKSQKSENEIEAQFEAVPNLTQQARQRSLFVEEAGSPLVETAIRRYADLTSRMNEEIEQRGPWLAGETFSLADTGIFPYVNRLHDLEWTPIYDGKTHYLDWFERMRARPSYKSAIADQVPQAAIDFARQCCGKVQTRLDEIFEKI
jgi:glutathione S-transferase